MDRELTFGEKAVGLTFNHAEGEVAEQVNSLKVAAAVFIDLCNDIRSKTESGEIKRLMSVAITDAQSAQMFAVKGATWKD